MSELKALRSDKYIWDESSEDHKNPVFTLGIFCFFKSKCNFFFISRQSLQELYFSLDDGCSPQHVERDYTYNGDE